jgi:ATP-dependent helicase/nuclease subunit A
VSRLQNRAISASAGTGKTFRLAHRYIGLMAAGVPPDRICALTFTRKAAGEIFDKIVALLTDAATRASSRSLTAGIIAREGFPVPADAPGAYVALLRRLLDQGHRLRIGTLDSFILGIVHAFPLELGISPETRPMDGEGGEAQALRQSILARLFDPAHAAGQNGGSALLSDFRLARSGQEGKQLGETLDRLITESYGFYRSHPGAAWHWGEAKRIWSDGDRWWEQTGSPADIAGDLPKRLAAAFGDTPAAAKLGAVCAAIASAAMTHASDKPWPDKLSSTVLTQLLKQAADPAPPVVKYNRNEYAIPEALWAEFSAALGNLIAVEVNRSVEKTRGLRLVLERYDARYAETLATGGPFTFEDLSLLLGTGAMSPSLEPAPPGSDRLYIDYRLDSRLDHWLLDEFQDTSDSQWRALANLIDEVMQDASRSFFYVGDVKQSIYGWRGGNHRLFHHVIEQYRNLGDRAIAVESIAACHRSLPAVIAAVNAVFEDLAGWRPDTDGGEPRPAAIEAFARFWKRHESARSDDGDGYAALVEYEPDKRRTGPGPDDDEEEEAGDPSAFRTVAAILKTVEPALERLSVAVLVRDNRAGRACVDTLRRLLPGMPVVHEGKGGIGDHPVVTLLLALVRQAAHPGDTVSWRHLQMSPLAERGALPPADELSGRVLGSLQARGFADTLRQWGEALGELDAFGRQRLRELLAAAEGFDARGICDADAFADHVAAYQVKSGAEAGAVRVMTIHQAKGLGFDLVVVPFAPNAKSFGKPGAPAFLAGGDWVLEAPRSTVLEVVGGPPLQALEAAAAESNFAQLCTLYVALTRARQALVMAVPARGKSSKTIREADLLRDRLVTEGLSETLPDGAGRLLYEAGDRDWHKRAPAPDNPPMDAGASPAPLALTYAVELARHEPSKEQDATRAFPARWLFSAEAGDVRAFGSAIHRLFEQIEWIETSDIDTIVAAWRRTAPEPATLLNDVERQFRNCLASDAIRRALTRPAGAAQAEVWREAPFNLLLPDAADPRLTSGRFDRVVVERMEDGSPVRATVFDYKSNRIETEQDMRETATGYAFQMVLYARAAARLLGLPPDQVTTRLLFTRKGWIWPEFG